ncbi:hypothetical protein [Anaerolentibacter hominis]|uniref:hypothetical protein n=1 Tax=Anaerolentibacter hominis TaxID=3079009 RepID=UPI0031B83EF4
MKRGILAIFDYEEDYVNRFLEYVNRKKQFLLETRVFTDAKKLADYCAREFIDLLLTVDTDILAGLDRTRIGHVLVLSEGMWVREGSDYPVIYKFQSMEEIMRAILDFYGTFHADLPVLAAARSQKTRIYTVFSPEGGRERTIFSIALGQAYAKEKDTLYLNLNVFPSSDMENGNGGMSELIYYIKQRSSNLIVRLQSLVNRMDQLYYIAPVSHFKDLEELGARDYGMLIQELRQGGDYDVVIIEAGSFGESTIALMDLSDQVYIPYGEEDAMTSIQVFQRTLAQEGLDSILAKLELIRFPHRRKAELEDCTQLLSDRLKEE